MAKYDEALVLQMLFDDELVVCSAPSYEAKVGDLVKLASGNVGKVVHVVRDYDGEARSLAAHFTTIRTAEAIYHKSWSREKETQEPAKPEVAEGA